MEMQEIFCDVNGFFLEDVSDEIRKNYTTAQLFCERYSIEIEITAQPRPSRGTQNHGIFWQPGWGYHHWEREPKTGFSIVIDRWGFVARGVIYIHPDNEKNYTLIMDTVSEYIDSVLSRELNALALLKECTHIAKNEVGR